MAGVARLLAARLPKGKAIGTRAITTSAVRAGADDGQPHIEATRDELYPGIGNREILCYGFSGDPTIYVGDPSFPAQTVRFQEDSDHVTKTLRPKELGDWKQMTLEEKKTLYRTAYQQTCVEYILQKRGRWKIDVNYNILIFAVSSLWTMWTMNYMAETRFYYDKEYQAELISDMYCCYPPNEEIGDVDYETGEWKDIYRFDWL